MFLLIYFYLLLGNIRFLKRGERKVFNITMLRKQTVDWNIKPTQTIITRVRKHVVTQSEHLDKRNKSTLSPFKLVKKKQFLRPKQMKLTHRKSRRIVYRGQMTWPYFSNQRLNTVNNYQQNIFSDINSVALVRKRTIPTERPPLSAK
jgi:hypothetical protein